MTQELTKETIMKMGLEVRLETAKFSKDAYEILVKKYENLQSSNLFIGEDAKKLLQEQIIMTIKNVAERDTFIQIGEMMHSIFVEK